MLKFLRPAMHMATFLEIFSGSFELISIPSFSLSYMLQIFMGISAALSIKMFMLKAARLSFLEKTGRAEGWEGFELIIWELMAKSQTKTEGGLF